MLGKSSRSFLVFGKLHIVRKGLVLELLNAVDTA